MEIGTIFRSMNDIHRLMYVEVEFCAQN